MGSKGGVEMKRGGHVTRERQIKGVEEEKG